LNDMPIRQKLMTALLLTSGAVLLLTCSAFITYEIINLHKGMLDGYRTRAEIIASNSTASLAFQNQADASDVLGALKTDARITEACVYDDKGKVFARYPADTTMSAFPANPGLSGYRNGHLDIFCPIIQGDRTLGTVYVQSNLSALTDRYRAYAWLAAAVIAASLLLAYLLSRMLQNQISLPVLALAETAKTVSKQRDFSVRAKKFGGDELGSLTDAFNEMLAEILAREQALKASEANYREIFDKANDGIIITDPAATENPILDMNASLEKMTGFNLEEYKKVPLEKLFSTEPGFTAADYAPLAQKALTEGPQLFEWLALHKDGHTYWIEVSLQKTILAGKTRLIAFMRDISDRKRLAEITRLGEAQAIESVKDYAIILLDREGKVLTWNAGAETIKGYKRAEILGKSISVFYTPEDNAKGHSKEVLESAVEKGRFEEEGWRVRKDGSRFEADVLVTALKNEKGELRGFVKVTRDVTEFKKAQRELQEKTELLDSILKNIADGVVVADDKGEFLLFNPAAEKISGRPGANAVPGMWTEQFGIFLPDGKTLFPEKENPLAKAVQGEETNNVEMFLRNAGHPEGILVSASGRPLKDEKGRKRGGVAIFRNITEQKKAEEQIKQANAFLNTVLENLPNMVFVKDAKDLKFVMFNKAGEELLGIPRTDLIGKNDYDFFPKDEADFFTSKDQKTIKDGKLLDVAEETIQTRHRGPRILHTKKIPVLDASGIPRFLLGISEDITEQKKQENLRIYAKALEASNKDLQDFIFVASHDLQEPLRKIQAFGNFLNEEEGKSLSETGKDYLKRIRDASLRMSTLLSDLLDLTRITTRAKPFVPVALNEIVQEVLSDLEIRLEETGGKVEAEALPTLDADPAQMRQLFQNLIGNALKFHKPGETPLIRISAAIDKGEGVCRIQVKDNGIGFDAKYAEKIFNIFQRLHGQGQYPGTGIGLAICRKVVERHGGKIEAQSQEGAGALFVITLPLRQAGMNSKQSES
jgi:PAS domain S-box-containing protein